MAARSPRPERDRSRSPKSRSPSISPRRYSPPRRSRSPPRRRSPHIKRGSERERRTSTTLFVGNLPYMFRERDVAEVFERCGRIRNVTVGVNRRTGQSKGYAFVEFEDRRDAEDAFDKFDGYVIEGRRLRLDWDIGLERKMVYGSSRSRRSPPRRGHHSRSPRRYSRSPRRYSRSPRRGSRSPRRGSRSPRRSRSPRNYSKSPRKSPSPGRNVPSPGHINKDDGRVDNSPRGGGVGGGGLDEGLVSRKRSSSQTRSPSPAEKRQRIDDGV